MKLSPEALLEIVAIFQDGLLGNKDASQALRELDLVPENEQLTLHPLYIASHPRATEWNEDDKSTRV